jgi:uncharacterized protein
MRTLAFALFLGESVRDLTAARLIFLAPDHEGLSRLIDATRVALAWGSTAEDVKEGRLNIDLLQKNQAEKELKSAEDVLLRAVWECFNETSHEG